MGNAKTHGSSCVEIAQDALLALELKGRMSRDAIHHQLNLACFLTSNAAGKYDKCKNWSVESLPDAPGQTALLARSGREITS